MSLPYKIYASGRGGYRSRSVGGRCRSRAVGGFRSRKFSRNRLIRSISRGKQVALRFRVKMGLIRPISREKQVALISPAENSAIDAPLSLASDTPHAARVNFLRERHPPRSRAIPPPLASDTPLYRSRAIPPLPRA